MTNLIETFEGVEITLRPGDQFWNATEMCKVSKSQKLVKDFLRLSSTKEYIKALADDLGVSPSSLIEIKKGGNKDEQGTWVHEDIAIELAGWINPKFRLWVNRIAKKLIRDKVVYLEDEIESLRMALSDTEAMVEAREYQLQEESAEARYWREELALYREGHHPDYEEVGRYKPAD